MASIIHAPEDHAQAIERQASELAEVLGAADPGSLLPLVQAQALVGLEGVRVELARVAEGILAHAAPVPGLFDLIDRPTEEGDASE